MLLIVNSTKQGSRFNHHFFSSLFVVVFNKCKRNNNVSGLGVGLVISDCKVIVANNQ